MESLIRVVTRYECTDGREFILRESAEHHQLQVNRAFKVNEAIGEGKSFADALRAGEWSGPIPDVFEQLTKDSKLVIEFWQCRDTPGYQVYHVTPDWKVRAGGNAGCWSGPYSSYISISDLARYASDPRSVLAPAGAALEPAL